MDFGTLKSRLLAQIGRAPSDICYELVTAEVNEALRLATMQAEINFSPVAEYTVGTGFLEGGGVSSGGGGYRCALGAQEPAAFDASWTVSGYPRRFSISDGVMRINGVTGGGTIYLRYYQRQADLSADGDTNEILTKHPSIYTYGVLAHHAALTQNPQALSVHFPAYERAVAMAKRADIKRRMGGNLAGPQLRATP